PDDARGLFAVAAVFFARADYAWAADGFQPEALWFFGPEAIERFSALAMAPPEGASRAFAEGGYVVMRSGWSKGAHQLIFDAGPLGCPMTGAHGHADLLSVQVSPFGEPCIVDPGTYAYSVDPLLRAHFRGTGAHATVTVDSLGQAEPSGNFGWKERPVARLRRFVSETAFDLADGSHEAFSRLQDPVSHRRRVVFVKSPGYWVIVDDLSGLRRHRVELRFQFCPLPLTLLPGSWARAELSGGRGLLLKTFSSAPMAVRIAQGSTEPLEGWVSPHYGQREPAPLLVHSVDAQLPLRVFTLLMPVSSKDTAPPRVQTVRGPDGALLGLTLEETNQTIRFDADTFTMGEAETWKA
ncbi:MAG: heparinase II/III-family protein, partial [Vicinamibacteria bacterium]|nr:heparinase II/III-family protein [Vicinamibacteria bacterium]